MSLVYTSVQLLIRFALSNLFFFFQPDRDESVLPPAGAEEFEPPTGSDVTLSSEGSESTSEWCVEPERLPFPCCFHEEEKSVQCFCLYLFLCKLKLSAILNG